MELNCFDRITLIQLLDTYEKGNFITFKTIDGLRSKLLVTEKEAELFELKIENSMYKWGAKGQEPTEIEITDGEKKIIADKLQELDRENSLTPQLVHFYEQFVI